MSREFCSATLGLLVLASGVIAAVLAAPTPAEAQTLYRCVQKGKPTSFQSAPCATTATTASAVAYVPEQDVPRYRPAPSHSPQPTRRQRTSSARVHQISMATNASACESARRRRDVVLGRNNQGGNVDVRRQLNDAVARACN